MITSHTDLRVRQNYGYNSRSLRDIPVASASCNALGPCRAATDSVARPKTTDLRSGPRADPVAVVEALAPDGADPVRQSEPGDWGVLVGMALIGATREVLTRTPSMAICFPPSGISMAGHDFRRRLATGCLV